MSLANVVDKAISLANPFIAIFIGLAIVYFIWGVAQFILASGNEEKVKEGREKIMWGVIAIFVMVALWGLAKLVLSTFGLQDSGVNNSLVHQLFQ